MASSALAESFLRRFAAVLQPADGHQTGELTVEGGGPNAGEGVELPHIRLRGGVGEDVPQERKHVRRDVDVRREPGRRGEPGQGAALPLKATAASACTAVLGIGVMSGSRSCCISSRAAVRRAVTGARRRDGLAAGVRVVSPGGPAGADRRFQLLDWSGSCRRRRAGRQRGEGHVDLEAAQANPAVGGSLQGCPDVAGNRLVESVDHLFTAAELDRA